MGNINYFFKRKQKKIDEKICYKTQIFLEIKQYLLEELSLIVLSYLKMEITGEFFKRIQIKENMGVTHCKIKNDFFYVLVYHVSKRHSKNEIIVYDINTLNLIKNIILNDYFEASKFCISKNNSLFFVSEIKFCRIKIFTEQGLFIKNIRCDILPNQILFPNFIENKMGESSKNYDENTLIICNAFCSEVNIINLKNNGVIKMQLRESANFVEMFVVNRIIYCIHHDIYDLNPQKSKYIKINKYDLFSRKFISHFYLNFEKFDDMNIIYTNIEKNKCYVISGNSHSKSVLFVFDLVFGDMIYKANLPYSMYLRYIKIQNDKIITFDYLKKQINFLW